MEGTHAQNNLWNICELGDHILHTLPGITLARTSINMLIILKDSSQLPNITQMTFLLASQSFI